MTTFLIVIGSAVVVSILFVLWIWIILVKELDNIDDLDN